MFLCMECKSNWGREWREKNVKSIAEMGEKLVNRASNNRRHKYDENSLKCNTQGSSSIYYITKIINSLVFANFAQVLCCMLVGTRKQWCILQQIFGCHSVMSVRGLGGRWNILISTILNLLTLFITLPYYALSRFPINSSPISKTMTPRWWFTSIVRFFFKAHRARIINRKSLYFMQLCIVYLVFVSIYFYYIKKKKAEFTSDSDSENWTKCKEQECLKPQ